VDGAHERGVDTPPRGPKERKVVIFSGNDGSLDDRTLVHRPTRGIHYVIGREFWILRFCNSPRVKYPIFSSIWWILRRLMQITCPGLDGILHVTGPSPKPSKQPGSGTLWACVGHLGIPYIVIHFDSSRFLIEIIPITCRLEHSTPDKTPYGHGQAGGLPVALSPRDACMS